jgi:hypothetical protein
MLANSLKVGKFQPINVALIGSSMEASGFAMNLGLALQSAGVLGQYFDLSSASAETKRHLGHSSSGTILATGALDASRLGEMLWRTFQIGGGEFPASLLSGIIPADQNTLIIDDNGWANSPGAGQPGEGIDAHGGADPAPH